MQTLNPETALLPRTQDEIAPLEFTMIGDIAVRETADDTTFYDPIDQANRYNLHLLGTPQDPIPGYSFRTGEIRNGGPSPDTITISSDTERRVELSYRDGVLFFGKLQSRGYYGDIYGAASLITNALRHAPDPTALWQSGFGANVATLASFYGQYRDIDNSLSNKDYDDALDARNSRELELSSIVVEQCALYKFQERAEIQLGHILTDTDLMDTAADGTTELHPLHHQLQLLRTIVGDALRAEITSGRRSSALDERADHMLIGCIFTRLAGFRHITDPSMFQPLYADFYNEFHAKLPALPQWDGSQELAFTAPWIK